MLGMRQPRVISDWIRSCGDDTELKHCVSHPHMQHTLHVVHACVCVDN